MLEWLEALLANPIVKNVSLVAGVGLLSAFVDFLFVKVTQFYLRRMFPAGVERIDLKKRLSTRLFFVLIALFGFFASTLLAAPSGFRATLKKVLFPLAIFFGCATLVAYIKVIGTLLRVRFDFSVSDNLRRRTIFTQIQFSERIIIIVLWAVAGIAIVFSFNSARELGLSLLASAGVLSLVITLAAQKSLSNFFAGFQIAFTQPIRLDDVVIVENQWGRIEEIALTYVVVCLWDLRRLIVPINYFTEKTFENWTRNSADLLPYVLIYTDFSLPVEPLREKFVAVVKESTRWDGKLAIMQVIDCSEKTMTIRGLMSASGASVAFDLRCEVREKLIAFIQENYPDSFPQTRILAPMGPMPDAPVSHASVNMPPSPDLG